jgi:hypothetical protein
MPRGVKTSVQTTYVAGAYDSIVFVCFKVEIQKRLYELKMSPPKIIEFWP